jgi:hypothetical protein
MKTYDRQEFWRCEAEEKGEAYVLGYIAASHEAFLGRFVRHRRLVVLVFGIVFSAMAYLHGFEAMANAISSTFGGGK